MHKNRNPYLISTVIYDLAARETDPFPILSAALKTDTFLLALASFLGYCFASIQNSRKSYNSCKMWILGWLCRGLEEEEKRSIWN